MKATANTILLLFLFFTSQAQTLKTVEDLDAKHQACLDTGVDMLGCTKTFYAGMDSMLNVVYQKLTASFNTKEKSLLKNQQRSWLKKRDAYFKRKDRIFDEKYDKGEWGRDMLMITVYEKAIFIRDRVIELNKRLNRKY